MAEKETKKSGQGEEESIAQIYDKIFKRILTLSSVAVINFINGIFGKNFPLDSKLTYNWTENIKDSLKKTIADAVITVNSADKVHTEAQIGNDSTIVVRVFDYGYQEALKYKTVDGDRIRLDFPEPKIIYLEHDGGTPDEVTLELNFKGQGKIEYKVPTIKFLDYSIEEIDKQHLVILLPLYLLKLRRDIEKEPTQENALKLKKLINEGIIATIEKSERAGNITAEDTVVLMGLIEKLYKHLYGNIEILKKEKVNEMISDKLILESDIILHKLHESEKRERQLLAENEKREKQLLAESAKREKQREENKALEIAKNLLDDGMTIEQAAKLTKLPISKIKKLQKP